MHPSRQTSTIDENYRAYREKLEALLSDQEFLSLTSHTKSLNLFEALGATRQELRHSNFLAFLLDPDEPHGLDTAFLRNFLTVATENLPLDHPLNSLEFRLKEFGTVEVHREWNHIDLLLLDLTERWVCAIENKVGSPEHGDQLDRYQKVIETEFFTFDSVYLYLSPEGKEPSNENYVSVSYGLVLEALESAIHECEDALSARALGILQDYGDIIRRHVIMESEVAEACRKIYRKHKDAIDLIIEHIPSVMDVAQSYLEERCQELCEEFDLIEDFHTRSGSLLRFCPRGLDVDGLRMAEGWTNSNRILLLEIDMRGDTATLKIVLGPGNQSFRRRVFDWLKSQGTPFKQVSTDEPKKKWQRLYEHNLFQAEELEELYLDEDEETAMSKLYAEVRGRLKEDLPILIDAVRSSDWFPRDSSDR